MTDFIDIHTHNPLSEDFCTFSVRLGIDQIPEGRRYSAGVHPWDIEKVDWRRQIELLTTLDVVAIGECGLDYTISLDREVQKIVFQKHIDIAVERNLPLIIHSVKANAEVIEMLKKSVINNAILHSFIGSKEQAAEIIRRGWLLSFGLHSLRSSRTMEIIKTAPISSILLESDENREGVSAIYYEVARLRNCTIEELKYNIRQNYIRIFESNI